MRRKKSFHIIKPRLNHKTVNQGPGVSSLPNRPTEEAYRDHTCRVLSEVAGDEMYLLVETIPPIFLDVLITLSEAENAVILLALAVLLMVQFASCPSRLHLMIRKY